MKCRHKQRRGWMCLEIGKKRGGECESDGVGAQELLAEKGIEPQRGCEVKKERQRNQQLLAHNHKLGQCGPCPQQGANTAM